MSRTTGGTATGGAGVSVDGTGRAELLRELHWASKAARLSSILALRSSSLACRISEIEHSAAISCMRVTQEQKSAKHLPDICLGKEARCQLSGVCRLWRITGLLFACTAGAEVELRPAGNGGCAPFDVCRPHLCGECSCGRPRPGTWRTPGGRRCTRTEASHPWRGEDPHALEQAPRLPLWYQLLVVLPHAPSGLSALRRGGWRSCR